MRAITHRKINKKKNMTKQTLPESQDCAVLAAVSHSQTAGEDENDVPNQQDPTVRKVADSAEMASVMTDEEMLSCILLAS